MPVSRADRELFPGLLTVGCSARDTGGMFLAAVGLGAGVPVVLGLLGHGSRHAASASARLLVAHGVSVGLLLGSAQVTSGGAAVLVIDQLAQGSWIFLFLWLVLIAYLVPDGRLRSMRRRLWVGAGTAGVMLFLTGAAGDADSFRQEHDGRAPPCPGFRRRSPTCSAWSAWRSW